ncbi:putative GMC oxidoreductase [Teratosphaeria nubilosa]|uniref:Putative GMC oxidoreductase n=1 Tax=Teratosphaeria nubilosa TaxID=161662 RepID=A0A6G1L284_9PEZI|nr:putative GMC oxidoreductase [Teratosphaeria nubilosa]
MPMPWKWLALSVGLFSRQTLAISRHLGNSFGIPGQNASYDYVVVGGGTAGNTIAARLALAGHAVAVIEAGSFYQISNGNGSIIPGLATVQFTGSEPGDSQPLIDWGLITLPQAGAGGREMHYAQGRTLGGSSGRHYMTFHHGTVGSYQKWADEIGDQSYTYENLIPFFRRSITLTPPNTTARAANASVRYNAALWSTDEVNTTARPLNLGWGNWAPALGTWAQKAMLRVGIPLAEDVLSGELSGSAWAPTTIQPKTQIRESSQTSFLDYANTNTNIQIYIQTVAQRIMFSENKTATSVLVDTLGVTYALKAKKEVILSAGVFKSPHLLMLSGVGPRQALEAIGVPVVADRPGVGQNLQDQPFGFGPSYRVNFITGSSYAINPAFAAAADASYLTDATGPLASPASFLAFEKLRSSRPDLLKNATIQALDDAFPDDWPDIEIIPTDGYLGNNRNYFRDAIVDGYNYATITPVLVAPLSLGNVSINSADYLDPPVINPNWLTHPVDQDMAIASFKRCRQIWEQMEALNITIGEEYFPGAKVKTDDEILEHIQQSMIGIYHGSSTCRMGKVGDKSAVVDSKARVLGVQGLRVVDASIMRFLPPGHPQSTIYMLAEKIAEDILSGHVQHID